MFSVVLATALTAGTAAPDLGWGHGCHGCYGCYGGYPYYAPVKVFVPVVPVYYGCGGCCGQAVVPVYYGCGGCCGYPVVPAYPVYYSWGGCCGGGWGQPVYYWPAPKMKPTGEDKDKDKDKGKKNGKTLEGDKDRDDDKLVRAEATVIVHAPKGVELRFNGVKVKRSGARESFQTPALAAGRDFHYVVTAAAVRDGRLVTEERRVVVRAGKKAEVDFRDMEATE